MMKQKAAIIGLGNIAWQYSQQVQEESGSVSHASAYLKSKNCELVAAFDISQDARERFSKKFPKVEVYSSTKEMFENESLDIISICSPSNLHFEHAVEALNQNIKGIWLEKPPVTGSTSQLEKLNSLANKNQIKVLVNYTRRYSKPYQFLKKFSEEESIRSIRLTYSRGLATNGSHLIDTLAFLYPNFKLYNLIGTLNKENSPSSLLSYQDIPIQISGIDVPYHCLDIELTSDKKRVSVLYNGSTLKIETKSENLDHPGFFLLKETSTDSTMGSPGKLMDIILCDLISSIDKNFSPSSNLETSLTTMRLLSLINGDYE